MKSVVKIGDNGQGFAGDGTLLVTLNGPAGKEYSVVVEELKPEVDPLESVEEAIREQSGKAKDYTG